MIFKTPKPTLTVACSWRAVPLRSALTALLLAPLAVLHAADQPARSNVLVIVTDDQGYGELSSHRNPVLSTPHLDRLHDESVRLTDFHVAPMCTPTRSQLMTGVDALRNGASNVSSGRTLLRRGFPTLGNLFADSGWSTGLFGKWHLGDTYPYRPQDRGFQETLWYPSSHIGSVPDRWENDYFDDTYLHNGRRQAYTGYTTDVFFREAMTWMKGEADAGRPFLCYLAPAAAHQPHYVPEKYLGPVRAALNAARSKLPVLEPAVEEQLVRFLAMCVNIDENMGRLEKFLTERGLRDNTVVIFLTDNGSTFGPKYFNAGMKGGKTTLWEGGHRVPCFVRWPGGGLRPTGDVGGLTEVQDLLPTLVELLGLKIPADTRFDGMSLAGVLRGNAVVPEDRKLVINFSRMPFNAVRTTQQNPAVPRREGAAVLWQRWRLLEDRELYQLDDDPMQEHNVIARHPEVVAVMRAHLDQWWDGVKERANDFEASVIGNDAENPVQLTACEWADVFIDQQAQVRRGDRKNGLWHIEVAAAGAYAFTVSRWPAEAKLRLQDGIGNTRVTDGVLTSGPAWPVRSARIRVGDVEQRAKVDAASRSVRFEMPLPAGRTTLQTWLDGASGGEIGGAYYVTVERLLTKPPVKLILDTDMSGDADDAGTLAMLHAMADRGECELLATIVNRADLTKASAAAVDAINTYYGRPNLPIGTDKVGPTALQRTSLYTPGLRDGFPNDIGPDDQAPDALDVYRRVLAAQPDGSVTVCSVGALSNLAELWRREPALVRAKIRRVVVMGGQFPPAAKPETNIATHPEAARLVAAEWPTEIVWQGFEVGDPVITGEALKRTPAGNPVRRAYELRRHAGRPSIEGGQPSYDQAAAFYAVRGANAELWSEERGGRVVIDEKGNVRYTPDDYRRMVRMGANFQVIRTALGRLGGWPGREPDPTYLAQLDEMVRMGKAAGLKTVFKLVVYDVRPFGNAQWDAIYRNTNGTQDTLLAAWSKLWVRYQDEPSVFGYDLLNEPQRGLDPDEERCCRELLLPTLRRLADAMHAISPRKWALYQPLYRETGAGDGPFLPMRESFGRDRIIFAPHLYTMDLAMMNKTLDRYSREAALSQAPLLLGEWGPATDIAADTDPAKQARYTKVYEATANELDRRGIGAIKAWFCGTRTPLKSKTRKEPFTWAIFSDTNAVGCVERKYITGALARPRPLAVAGNLERYGFDFATRTLEASLQPDAKLGSTEIFVAAERFYPDGFRVEVVPGLTLVLKPGATQLSPLNSADKINREQALHVLWNADSQHLVIEKWIIAAPRLTLKISPLQAAETPPAKPFPRVLFRQPELAVFGNRMYVQARVPSGDFAMISWQKSPFTPDGKFVPVGWDAGAKTGLAVTGDRPPAQRGMRDTAGATTAQMSGDAVGAYLNSADLSGSGTDAQGRPLPGSDGFKMMVTPQIRFASETAVRPFSAENGRLDLSLDLQIPVATCGEKKGSLAYVNPVLLLVDPQRAVKISYVVDLFSRRSTGNPLKVIQHIAHDGPTKSWMTQCKLVPGNPWVEMGKGSEVFQTAPWRGWRSFSCTLTRDNVLAALKALREQEPETNCSLDPADYQLNSFHLNAEITFETAPAEMGWSMRRALLTLDERPLPRQ